MKTSLFFAFLLVLFSTSFAQNKQKYNEHVDTASALYHSKEYKKSAAKYLEAFELLEGKAYPNDRYNAACSYALAQDTENSFYHLFRLAESTTRYSDYHHITNDTDLNSLHKDKRWNKLIALVKANKEEKEKYYDKPLVAILDTIYKDDQTDRRKIDQITNDYGYQSDEMINLWDTIIAKDSINQIKVMKIIDERGWLGVDIIGKQGNNTLFLVIQHADLDIQLKYWPIMQQAVKDGNIRKSAMALLEDRIALRQGKKQIYGSQIQGDIDGTFYYVRPLIDPENVDIRRAEVGLNTMAEYVKRWDITWDVEKYIESLKTSEETEQKKE
jgi:hypothetical protein